MHIYADMTPFLRSIDPDGHHHREMGEIAARFAFERYPLGGLPADFVSHLEALASAQMKPKLIRCGVQQDDMIAAFRRVADEFAKAYGAMVDQFAASCGGHA